MENIQLGKLERISDLRSVWKHEEYDFSNWLAKEDNLQQLSDEIGIDIELEQKESNVGRFSVDIFATEVGTGRKIIIENQLENTNHDHLGKLITYASGKGAEIIIWIVKRALPEHRNAIDWLNEHTDEKIGFFLVEIELWKINDSLVAPKFNVVECPNDWAKTMKASSTTNSDSGILRVNFWQGFNDYVVENKEFSKEFRVRKPYPQSWMDLSIGTSAYWINLSIDTQKKNISAGIYINDSFELYNHFQSNRDKIEAIVGGEVVFKKAKKNSRFRCFLNDVDVNDQAMWPKAYAWFMDMALRFKRIHKELG